VDENVCGEEQGAGCPDDEVERGALCLPADKGQEQENRHGDVDDDFGAATGPHGHPPSQV